MRRNVIMAVISGLFLLTAAATSQTLIDSSLSGRRIASIQVTGNEKTRSDFILRELKQRPGDLLDLELTEAGRKRIQNLNLFHRVLITGEPQEDTVDLTIAVTEQWYIFPLPVLHLNERSWKKVSYGAGLAHLNFRGRGEQLMILGKGGYIPSLQLNYSAPWLIQSQNISGGLTVNWQKVKSKYYTAHRVYEKYLSGSVSLGKRFGHHFKSQLKAGYQSVALESNQLHVSQATQGAPFAVLRLVWDHRDLIEYPHEGWYFDMAVRKNGLNQAIDYWRLGMDGRIYLPIQKTTLAFRTAGVFSRGEIPVYDLVYLGFSERIRGHFFTESQGEHRMLASAAWRFPLIPVRYVHTGPQASLQNWPFGMSAGVFWDSGLVWHQGQRVNGSMLMTGFGAGLHVHLPFIQLLRVETALNESGRAEFIVDIMVYF